MYSTVYYDAFVKIKDNNLKIEYKTKIRDFFTNCLNLSNASELESC